MLRNFGYHGSVHTRQQRSEGRLRGTDTQRVPWDETSWGGGPTMCNGRGQQRGGWRLDHGDCDGDGARAGETKKSGLDQTTFRVPSTRCPRDKVGTIIRKQVPTTHPQTCDDRY